MYFNPRTPCGVRPESEYRCQSSSPFQSTHPLRGATNIYKTNYNFSAISIHAPLAGCDLKAEKADAELAISIHAPLAGCDSAINDAMVKVEEFQSTHPLRGAT